MMIIKVKIKSGKRNGKKMTSELKVNMYKVYLNQLYMTVFLERPQ